LTAVICLHPPAENGQAYKPWRLRDSADAVATKPAPLMLDSGFVSRVGQCGPDKQDVRLAEALVNYQLRLLTAMDGINDKIERVNRPDEVDSAGRPSTYEKTGIVEMDAMEAKLDGLEAGDRKLQSALDAVQADFEAMADKLKKGIVRLPLPPLRHADGIGHREVIGRSLKESSDPLLR